MLKFYCRRTADALTKSLIAFYDEAVAFVTESRRAFRIPAYNVNSELAYN